MTPAELEALILSLKVACLSSLLATPGALFVGWLLGRHDFRGKTVADAMLHLPLVMPPVTVGYLLLVVFGLQGWVGSILYNTLGIRIAFTFWAAVLASLIVAFPLYVRPVRVAFEMSRAGYEEVAETLGASRWRVFCTITLPLALPGVVSGFILAFARSLGEFGATVTLAGNIEGETRTIPLAIYTYMNTPNGEGPAMRLACFSVVLSLLAFGASEIVVRFMKQRVGAHSP